MEFVFGSDDWVRGLMDAINASDEYAKAARNWEGDFYFVINQGDGFSEETKLYLDLQHGKCHEAFVDTTSTKMPAFILSAPITIWKKILTGKLNPIQGLVSKQLKIKGNMGKIMRAPKAAIELVKAAQTLETTWP